MNIFLCVLLASLEVLMAENSLMILGGGSALFLTSPSDSPVLKSGKS